MSSKHLQIVQYSGSLLFVMIPLSKRPALAGFCLSSQQEIGQQRTFIEIRHQTSGQPHQFDVALGFSLQASARLDAVEIAVNVDFQQDREVVSRPASVGWNGTFKTQIDQVEFVDKDVDYAHRIGIADVVVEALGK